MTVKHNISLLPYNTFGIDVKAQNFVAIHDEAELEELLSSGLLQEAPYLILGGGSNMVFTQDFLGTVVHLENKGIRKIDDALTIEAAAGVVWDDFVRYCLAQGWYGVENLVAIPGTVGASPVQNVGAYGVEAKDVIKEVSAYEIATGKRRLFSNEECRFAYRNSIFKQELKNQYIVTKVSFRLSDEFRPNLGYKAVAQAMEATGQTHPSAIQLADAIADIRWNKLPRPELMGSAGSFFMNPVVTDSVHAELKERFPDMVSYLVDDGHYKLAAGWLIEHAGWKGKSLGLAGVYDKQALVLVNKGGCSGSDVLRLADAVVADVEAKFGVSLQKEAIII